MWPLPRPRRSARPARQLRGAALPQWVRGAGPADRAALAELISTLSRFAADMIDEIDLNPVIFHP